MAPLLKSQAGPGTGGFPPSLPVMEATGPWRVWDASPHIRAEPQAREGPGSPAPRRCQKHLRLKKPRAAGDSLTGTVSRLAVTSGTKTAP